VPIAEANVRNWLDPLLGRRHAGTPGDPRAELPHIGGSRPDARARLTVEPAETRAPISTPLLPSIPGVFASVSGRLERHT